MLFELSQDNYISDNGVAYCGYGIRCGTTVEVDISADREEVEALAHLCNQLDLPPEELHTVAIDFLAR